MIEITNRQLLNSIAGGLCICNNMGGGFGVHATNRIHRAETCRRHCCVVHSTDSWTLTSPTNIIWGECYRYKLFTKPNIIELRSGNKMSLYHCSPKFKEWPHNY